MACAGGKTSLQIDRNGTKNRTTIKSRCEEGFSGVVCAICKEGYYLSDEFCVECPESKHESRLLIGCVFGGIFSIFLITLCRTMQVNDSKAHWRRATRAFIDHKDTQARMLDREQLKNMKQFVHSVSAALKSFIGFIQILSVSDSAFNIPWPKSFINFLRFTSPFNFDFISVTGVGCLVKYDFFDSFQAMMSMPAAAMSLVLTAYFIRLQIYKRKYGKSFKKAMRDTFTNRVIQFTLWVILLVYPPISRRAIEYFRCTPYIDGKSYLVKDFTIECYAGKWNDYLIYGVIGVLVYPVGIPLLFTIQLWRKRKHLDDRHVLNRLGFLYAIYRRETFLWDIWEMLQKLFLTGIIALIFPGQDLQVVIVVLFDLFFLCILLAYKPHIIGPTRNLASLSSVAITLTMYCGLILKTIDGVDKHIQYRFVIEMFLILINSTVAIYALKQILPFIIVWQTVKKQMKKKRLEKKHRQKLQRQKSIAHLNNDETTNAIIRSLTTSSAIGSPKSIKDKRRMSLNETAVVNNLFSIKPTKSKSTTTPSAKIRNPTKISPKRKVKVEAKTKSSINSTAKSSLRTTKSSLSQVSTITKTKKLAADKSKKLKIKIKRKSSMFANKGK